MTKEQTLQGMKKELTEAIRRSASEKDKAGSSQKTENKAR